MTNTRVSQEEMSSIQKRALQEGLCIAICVRGAEMGVMHHARVEAEAEAGIRDITISLSIVDGGEKLWDVFPTSELGDMFMAGV